VCGGGGRDREDVHNGVGVCRVHVVRGLVILLSTHACVSIHAHTRAYGSYVGYVGLLSLLLSCHY
jgi:hypothetical protein